MDYHFNQNLTKLSQLFKKKEQAKQIKSSATLHLILARSASISTQSSSRLGFPRSLQSIKINSNKYTSAKSINTQTLNTMNTLQTQTSDKIPRKLSIAQKIKYCNTYKQLHTLHNELSNSDGFCGLKKILNNTRQS